MVLLPLVSDRDPVRITAAATIAYTIVTAGLAWAAFLAWRSAQGQIRQGETTLKAAHRPLVIIGDAWVARAGELQLHVLLKNIGPGLAIRVEIRAWLVESGIGADVFEFRARRDQARREIDFDTPQFLVELPGLATHEAQLVPMSLVAPETAPATSLRRPILLYIALYQNVFKEEFPSVPRQEWEAGSFLFPPGWQTRNSPLVHGEGL